MASKKRKRKLKNRNLVSKHMYEFNKAKVFKDRKKESKKYPDSLGDV